MANTTLSNFSTTFILGSSTSEFIPRLDEEWFSYDIDILFGVILGLLTIFATVENILVFGMFFKYRREFSSRTTKLLMSLAVSDGLMAVIGGTMFSASSFNHKWLFGLAGCQFYGFAMYATGCVDIAHLMVIAIDRMLAITSPIKYKALGGSKAATLAAILFSWVYGSIWAFLPLFGVQEYTYEGKTSCSINWLSKRPVDIAYNILIFIFTFFFPIIIMTGCYLFIYLTVRAAGKRFAGGDDFASKKKRETEKKLAMNLALTMVLYCLFWTPYAIVSMWGSFGDASVIPSSARGFPAVFAKCSMAINPVVYVLSNKTHRRKLRAFLGMSVAVDPEEKTQGNTDNTGNTGTTRAVKSSKPTTTTTNNNTALVTEDGGSAATDVTRF